MRELTPEELHQLETMTDSDNSQCKYAWDDTFQRKLLGMLLTDQYMLVQSIDKIKPEYFSNEAHVIIAKILLRFFYEHKSIPEKWIVEQELSEQLKERDEAVKLHYKSELYCVYNYFVPGLESREYLIEKVTYFAKVQAVKVAFHNSLEKMTEAPESEKTWNFVYEQMRQAMLVDRSYEPGLEYFMNIDEMFRRMDDVFVGKDRFTSGFPSIDNALTGGGLFPGQIASWIGLPGTGKTHLAGTLILMADGQIKKCEDIVVGDLVMGDDSTPRRVLATHSLVDQIYEVRPSKGDSYFVNSKHILSLKNSHKKAQLRKDRGSRTGDKNYRNPKACFHDHPSRMGETDIYNISVEDWFKQSQHFKSKMKGWRTGVSFAAQDVLIDPYILGVWLGDGSANDCSFTNIDEEVRITIEEFANEKSLIFYEMDEYKMSVTSIEGSNSIKNNCFYLNNFF